MIHAALPVLVWLAMGLATAGLHGVNWHHRPLLSHMAAWPVVAGFMLADTPLPRWLRGPVKDGRPYLCRCGLKAESTMCFTCDLRSRYRGLP